MQLETVYLIEWWRNFPLSFFFSEPKDFVPGSVLYEETSAWVLINVKSLFVCFIVFCVRDYRDLLLDGIVDKDLNGSTRFTACD